MSDKDEMPSHHGVDAESGGEYPNDTMRLLIDRSSCRSYHDKKIPTEVMNLILEAGTHAATAGNLQPFSIIKIEDIATKKKLAKLNYDQEFIANAPVDLLFCIDWHRLQRWAEVDVAPFAANHAFRHFWVSFQDTIIAAQNICTAADAMGLGSCYVGTITESWPEMKEMFNLPDGVFPVVLLSLGYPKQRPAVKRKLDISVITHDETYQELSDEELSEAYHNKYPALRVEATKERLAEISAVCTKIHGKDFADKCIERIKKQGYINPVQRYFGLHYTADHMASDNDKFMRIVKDYGFGWFKKWVPEGE